jgi:hypothetical protein
MTAERNPSRFAATARSSTSSVSSGGAASQSRAQPTQSPPFAPSEPGAVLDQRPRHLEAAACRSSHRERHRRHFGLRHDVGDIDGSHHRQMEDLPSRRALVVGPRAHHAEIQSTGFELVKGDAAREAAVVVVGGHVSPDTNLAPENVRRCQDQPGRVRSSRIRGRPRGRPRTGHGHLTDNAAAPAFRVRADPNSIPAHPLGEGRRVRFRSYPRIQVRRCLPELSGLLVIERKTFSVTRFQSRRSQSTCRRRGSQTCPSWRRCCLISQG